jgi:hypothetical protein
MGLMSRLNAKAEVPETRVLCNPCPSGIFLNKVDDRKIIALQ